MKAPDRLETARLLLRRPTVSDAEAVFTRYATEALRAMVGLAPSLGVRRLFALCHPDHHASWRVLEKGGMVREAVLRRYAEFPNLAPGEPSDVLCYVTIV